MSQQVAIAKTTDQGVARAALIKLLFFAAALAILPIGSYFVASKYVWTGTTNIYPAVTAICVANIVLVTYIIISVLEDQQSLAEQERKKLSESKKDR